MILAASSSVTSSQAPESSTSLGASAALALAA